MVDLEIVRDDFFNLAIRHGLFRENRSFIQESRPRTGSVNENTTRSRHNSRVSSSFFFFLSLLSSFFFYFPFLFPPLFRPLVRPKNGGCYIDAWIDCSLASRYTDIQLIILVHSGEVRFQRATKAWIDGHRRSVTERGRQYVFHRWNFSEQKLTRSFFSRSQAISISN